MLWSSDRVRDAEILSASVLHHSTFRVLYLYTIDLICLLDRSSRSLYFWTLLINTFTLRCKGTIEKLMVAQQIKKFATCMDPEKSSPDSTSYAIPSQFNQSYFPQTHFNIMLLFTFMSVKHSQDSRCQKGDMNQVPYWGKRWRGKVHPITCQESYRGGVEV